MTRPLAEMGHLDPPSAQAHMSEEPRALPHAPIFREEALGGGSRASDPLSSRADPGHCLTLLRGDFSAIKWD